MKLLFLQDNGINESLALTELSAFLKSNGHKCDLLLEDEERHFLQKVSAYNPDVILIPATILGWKWALDTSKKIKQHFDIPVIIGGEYPTFYPEVIENDSVDIICRGEAEHAILELLQRIEDGKSITDINNLYVKQNGKIYRNDMRMLIANLDELPMPDRELYYKYKFLRNIPLKRFSSGRGCHNSCTYCPNTNLRSEYEDKVRCIYVRKKSVNRIIEEILYIKEKYPLSMVHFSDDIFIWNVRWVEDFCDAYSKKVGLPFTFNTTADSLTSALIEKLKSAGCSGIAFGIETGNEERRVKILNKHVSNDQLLRAAGWLHANGIRLATFNIIAIPGEEIEEAFETVHFNQLLKPDVPRVNIYLPLKNTRLTEYGFKKGCIEGGMTGVAINKLGEDRKFKNLHILFPYAVKYPTLENIIRKLVKLPLYSFYKLFELRKIYDEKKFYRIPFISGLRFYYHCNPTKRTKNFHFLI